MPVGFILGVLTGWGAAPLLDELADAAWSAVGDVAEDARHEVAKLVDEAPDVIEVRLVNEGQDDLR